MGNNRCERAQLRKLRADVKVEIGLRTEIEVRSVGTQGVAVCRAVKLWQLQLHVLPLRERFHQPEGQVQLRVCLQLPLQKSIARSYDGRGGEARVRHGAKYYSERTGAFCRALASSQAKCRPS